MKWSTLALTASLLQSTVAQTPEGFTPVVEQTLSMSYGNNSVSPAGELIPRPETATPPTIISSVPSTTEKTILFMIDLDVPRNGTRIPNLHWFVPDLTSTPNTALSIPIPSASGGATYRQPSPPVGDSPHRYIFLLFSQPNSFSIPPSFQNLSANRIGFNLSSFVDAAGLGVPYAGNWILVQNTTGIGGGGGGTQSFPPASFTVGPTAGMGTETGSAGTVTATGAAGRGIVVGGVGAGSVWGLVVAGLGVFGLL